MHCDTLLHLVDFHCFGVKTKVGAVRNPMRESPSNDTPLTESNRCYKSVVFCVNETVLVRLSVREV